jgi:hypothetical protein
MVAVFVDVYAARRFAFSWSVVNQIVRPRDRRAMQAITHNQEWICSVTREPARIIAMISFIRFGNYELVMIDLR